MLNLGIRETTEKKQHVPEKPKTIVASLTFAVQL